jgi:hypothetical protein
MVKGSKASAITRERLRISHLGHVHSAEHKRKIGLASKGNKYCLGRRMTPENIELKRKQMIGKQYALGYKHTDDAKRRISLGLRGCKARSWKGGITPLMVSIRHCFKNRQWISDIFTRDNFICQDCLKRGGDMVAHHIKEFNKIILEYNITSIEQAYQCEELWNINNGITLCIPCHKIRHKIRK